MNAQQRRKSRRAKMRGCHKVGELVRMHPNMSHKYDIHISYVIIDTIWDYAEEEMMYTISIGKFYGNNIVNDIKENRRTIN
jgi:hypothetical protein